MPIIKNMQQKKGRKRIKNEGILHDEVKSRHHILVTPSSWEKMKEYANRKGISVSECIEMWARNIEGE